jgi:hypothetical protein
MGKVLLTEGQYVMLKQWRNSFDDRGFHVADARAAELDFGGILSHVRYQEMERT